VNALYFTELFNKYASDRKGYIVYKNSRKRIQYHSFTVDNSGEIGGGKRENSQKKGGKFRGDVMENAQAISL
jgi:hypothetical protein